MMDSLRCPRPTRPEPAIQAFSPSGPRWAIASVIFFKRSREIWAGSEERMPAMPHIVSRLSGAQTTTCCPQTGNFLPGDGQRHPNVVPVDHEVCAVLVLFKYHAQFFYGAVLFLYRHRGA